MTRAELGGRIEYILDYEGVKHPRDVANRILALLEQETATDFFVGPFGPFIHHDEPMLAYVHVESGRITGVWMAPPTSEVVGELRPPGSRAHDSEAGKND